MKKQLNTESVTNELRGASAFFRRREEPPPSPEPQPAVSETRPKAVPSRRSPERPNERTPKRAHATPNARTGDRLPRRSVKRYSFELYDDQIEHVKRLALEDQLRGGTLNMSVIVRQAIDRYLAELEGKGE